MALELRGVLGAAPVGLVVDALFANVGVFPMDEQDASLLANYVAKFFV